MRGSPGASDTALARAVMRGLIAFLPLLALGCAYGAPRQATERTPPPRVLVVKLEKVALRTSAWVELHASLAATGAYAVVRAADPRDAQLGRTTAALQKCEDERCARAAVTGSPFADAYLAALPGFLARDWTDRATISRAGVETARAAIPEEIIDPLVEKLAKDLAIDWPAPPPVVDVVTASPEPGPEAPIRVLLGARTTCFARFAKETERMHDARITDCVLGYAAVQLAQRSALGRALDRELAARGLSAELERAWTALVVHAVATTVTAWEPKHASPLQRSAAAVMPDVMAWLAREWPARMRGGSIDDLAKAYAALLAAP